MSTYNHDSYERNRPEPPLDEPQEKLYRCVCCDGTGRWKSRRFKLSAWCLSCLGNGAAPAHLEPATEDAQDENAIDEGIETGNLLPVAGAVLKIQLHNGVLNE